MPKIETDRKPQLSEVTEDLSNETLGVDLIELAYSDQDSALHQTMQCSLGTEAAFDREQYISDVQRVIAQLSYDKIDDYHDATFVKCADGIVFEEPTDFSITKSNGMCYELASNAATLVKLMHPERDIIIAQDMKRPSGWNHFYVVDQTVDAESGQATDPLVIDPAKNKVGALSETGEWDNSGVPYQLDQTSGLHNPEDTAGVRFHTSVSTPEQPSRQINIALISPRHFNQSENMEPFGVALQLDTDSSEPLISLSRDGMYYNASP